MSDTPNAPKTETEKSVTVTVRLSELNQARLQAFKVQRVNAGGKWLSNQAVVLEALELLLTSSNVADTSTPKQLGLFSKP